MKLYWPVFTRNENSNTGLRRNLHWEMQKNLLENVKTETENGVENFFYGNRM